MPSNERLWRGDDSPVLRLARHLDARRPRSEPDDDTRDLVAQVLADLPVLHNRPKALVDYVSFTFGVELDEAVVRGALDEREA